MHLEMVRATNTNKLCVIKVGYYSGPWPTPEPDRGGDREQCEPGEEGWTTCIRSEVLYKQRAKSNILQTHTHSDTDTSGTNINTGVGKHTQTDTENIWHTLVCTYAYLYPLWLVHTDFLTRYDADVFMTHL